MPHRLDFDKFPGRTKIETVAHASTKTLARRAADKRGLPSVASYVRTVLIEAICADLDLDTEKLLSIQPPDARQREYPNGMTPKKFRGEA